MRNFRRLVLGLVLVSLAGCSSVPVPDETLVLVDRESGIPLGQEQATLLEAACLVQMYKIPVPAMPVRRQAASRTEGQSGALGSFMAGANASASYREDERAREARREAFAQREKVFEACLIEAGARATYVIVEAK